MTVDQLRKLIAGGETLDVELKGEEREALNDADLVEAVVCLSNRAGTESGWLLVGVEDDGRVIGARPRHENGTTDVRRVQALIANRTRPPVSVQVSLLSIDAVDVLVVQVQPGQRVVGTSDAKYIRRTIGGDGRPACVPYYHDEATARIADLGEVDYTAFEVRGSNWSDLDPLEFDRFRRTVRESKGAGDASLVELPDAELARALGVVADGDGEPLVRVAALLLFGTENAIRSHLPTYEAAFQLLVGTEVKVNDFFRWPLLRLMDELMNRFRARYEEVELLEGMVRIGVPNYPERAYREAVANAFIHRDYMKLGAVHVQWHENRIEVSNPGGFPDGVRLDNLLVTAPRPRNPLLADAFKRAGIVDRTGRGIDSIFAELLRNGRPAPSYQRSTANTVVVIMPGTEPDKGFVRLVAEQDKTGQPLKLDELLVLRALLDERRVAPADAAQLIQKPEAEAKEPLERLVGIDMARRTEDGAYAASKMALSYVVRRQPRMGRLGFTEHEQKERILQHIRMNKSINSRKAAEICGVNQRAASYLLGKMHKVGKLRKVGSRRWTRYVLPDVDL